MKTAKILKKSVLNSGNNWITLLNSANLSKKNAVTPVNFHLYHYAANNPVRYTDPDGRDIYLSYDIKKQTDFYLKYEKAVNYLMKSSVKNLVNTIFSDLRDSAVKITVVDTIFDDKYNTTTDEVIWNPFLTSYNDKTLLYNSSAIALMHELIHSWVDTTENGKNTFKSFLEKNQKNLDAYYDKHASFFKKINWSKEKFYSEFFTAFLEKTIAIDLGEPVTRQNYFELDDTTSISVDDVTEAGKWYGLQD